MKIWPEYIISFVITFIVIHLLGKSKLGIGAHLWDSKFEIVLLQGIGLRRDWDYINPTLWYLSVMLIAGFIIYFEVSHLGKIFEYAIAPAIILASMVLMFVYVKHLDSAVMMHDQKINFPLLRGLAEMCLGMYAKKLNSILSEKKSTLPFSICGTLSFLMAIYIASFYGRSRWDFVEVIFIFIGVSCAFLPIKMNDKISKPFVAWSEITFELYLIHEVFRMHLFPFFFDQKADYKSKMLYMLLYLICVTVAALPLHLIGKLIGKGINQLKKVTGYEKQE